ncbi:uncharacterized protein LOC101761096 isoform X3 [Setaria italica]|uniref:uncharacterized protein LOC101761096 isoform X3 n=1 Tax=Setaria italica TaxID=4555 RepID=UPI000BE4C537|nr:uncharacterized protein LOC101761096 isoform X3 [Setaria italica]
MRFERRDAQTPRHCCGVLTARTNPAGSWQRLLPTQALLAPQFSRHLTSPMACAAADAGAGGGVALAGMHDLRLRPRLLRSLLDDCLPLPVPGRSPPRRPADLAYAADAVCSHGLLAEPSAGRADPGVLEEWEAAVDAWVHRLLELIGSDKEPSCNKMVNMFTCTTMSDLFLRLATFPNLKDEAISFAQKVVKPLLQLLDENGPVAEKAVDLLGLLIKLFPSSVYRHFNNVESTITTKIMSGQCNLQELKKLASTLALLPYVRFSQCSTSLMIQKLLVMVNNMLNDTFVGLEKEDTDYELMMLLAPPGSKLVPPLGGQTTCGDKHIHSTKKFHAYIVPTISALVHCCSMMLTSPYPAQVINIPVRALVTLIQKVLLIDGSLLLQSNTPLCQELICSEIPTLHSIFLDLLASTIKGMRSSLVPHAGTVVMLIAEYFKKAKLPALRRKLYTIVQLLLSSMGVGMAVQLFQVVVSNIFADLDDDAGSSSYSLRTYPIEATIWSSSKSSDNRRQTQQLQSSIAVSSEPTCNRQLMPPLCVKIAALETLELILNLGGLFNGSWRSEMDLLLIDVATKACYKAGMYEQSPPWTEDPSISDFQLAAFRALLASFLSTHHERPLYLEEGLELFNRGKLETGTELAKFCSHALLALDARIHPRQLHPQYISKIVARDDLGFVSQPSHSVRKHRATDDLGDDCMYRLVSVAIEPVDPLTKDNAVENCTPVEFSGELSMQNDAQQTHIITGEHPPEITAYCLTEEVQAVKMTDGLYGNPSDFGTLGNSIPPDSFSFTPPDFYNPGDETSTKKCILSGDASSRQNVPNHASGTSTAASVCHSEWDSLDPLLDIGDANLDPGFFPDMVDVDPGSD